MNYKKLFWTIIWLVIIFIGAGTMKFIPENFIYTYGFLFGCLSMGALEMRK